MASDDRDDPLSCAPPFLCNLRCFAVVSYQQRGVLKVFLGKNSRHSHSPFASPETPCPLCCTENVIKDAATYAEHGRRKTITAMYKAGPVASRSELVY